ncbi:MAG: non-canonical purine NTP pyrophosphatase [Patescibacteria group bacterium]|jgi:XTP/dITP diphosphohydrolase
MKKTILIATANQGKAREIREIFKNSNYDLKFLYDYKDKIADLKVQENAESFEGNALIKAIVIGDNLQMTTLADDSGICIDALGGEPGICSSRYSEEGTDEANNRKVLSKMNEIPMSMRGCHYNCNVAIYDPSTKFVKTTEGRWDGRIALEPKGTKSFGYAPIFLSKNANYKKTNAEFDPNDLIEINHRGKAFRSAIKELDKYFSL